MIIVQVWASQRKLNDISYCSLSSSSWVVLVIHYLQRTTPAVLPLLLPHETNEISLNETYPCHTNSVGAGSLAYHLLEFFRYYGMTLSLPSSFSSLAHNGETPSICLEEIVCTPEVMKDWPVCFMHPVEVGQDLDVHITREEGLTFIRTEFKRAFIILDNFLSSWERDEKKVIAARCLSVLCTPGTYNSTLPVLSSLCSTHQHVHAVCSHQHCGTSDLSGHVAQDDISCRSTIPSTCHGIHQTAECDTGAVDHVENVYPERAVVPFLTQYMRTSRGNGQSLINTVLKWTVQEFCNPQLLLAGLRRIPSEFESRSQWFGSFYQFVVEEVRCELQQVADADFAGIDRTTVVDVVSKSDVDVDNGVKMILQFIAENFEDTKKLMNVSTCLCLAVENCPEVITLEHMKKLPHFLIYVGFSPMHHKVSDTPPDTFEARAAATDASVRFVNQRGNGWTILCLGASLITAERLCDGLAAQISPPFMSDILKARMVSYVVDTKERSIPLGDYAACADLLTSLNTSQKEAIENVLSVGLPDIPRIQIIKGPPGNEYITTTRLDVICHVVELRCRNW